MHIECNNICYRKLKWFPFWNPQNIIQLYIYKKTNGKCFAKELHFCF